MSNSWQTIPGSNPTLVTVSTQVRTGFNSITHLDGVQFGAMLYAMESGHGGIAHAVGSRLEGINPGYTPPALPAPPGQFVLSHISCTYNSFN